MKQERVMNNCCRMCELIGGNCDAQKMPIFQSHYNFKLEIVCTENRNWQPIWGGGEHSRNWKDVWQTAEKHTSSSIEKRSWLQETRVGEWRKVPGPMICQYWAILEYCIWYSYMTVSTIIYGYPDLWQKIHIFTMQCDVFHIDLIWLHRYMIKVRCVWWFLYQAQFDLNSAILGTIFTW